MIEKQIKKADIKSFPIILEEAIESDLCIVGRLVSLRRLFDLLPHHKLGYELLSSLLKLEQVPTYKTPDGKRELLLLEIFDAEKDIQKYISDFTYSSYLDILSNKDLLFELYSSAKTNYEKLQIFRILVDKLQDHGPIVKFINETFHIENDYLFQINPYKFDPVPDYIVHQCDLTLR